MAESTANRPIIGCVELLIIVQPRAGLFGRALYIGRGGRNTCTSLAGLILGRENGEKFPPGDCEQLQPPPPFPFAISGPPNDPKQMMPPRPNAHATHFARC